MIMPLLDTGFTDQIWNILACPYCRGALQRTVTGAICSACHETYSTSANGQLDFRLRKPQLYPLIIQINSQVPKDIVEVTKTNPAQTEVNFGNMKIPPHLNKELLKHFPKAKTNHSFMLDLGCGRALHREVCQCAGFKYVGVDIAGSQAQILGDAHALPFADNSFEFILSLAVLEHSQYPLVMLNEVHRILKPGGKFIGTVAFLEPFHADSYYHHTHLGAFNSLQAAKFEIERVGATPNWSVLTAISRMGLFPCLPQPIAKAITMPLYLLHRIWWAFGYLITHSPKASNSYRELMTAGSFYFVATKTFEERQEEPSENSTR